MAQRRRQHLRWREVLGLRHIYRERDGGRRSSLRRPICSLWPRWILAVITPSAGVQLDAVASSPSLSSFLLSFSFSGRVAAVSAAAADPGAVVPPSLARSRSPRSAVEPHALHPRRGRGTRPWRLARRPRLASGRPVACVRAPGRWRPMPARSPARALGFRGRRRWPACRITAGGGLRPGSAPGQRRRRPKSEAAAGQE